MKQPHPDFRSRRRHTPRQRAKLLTQYRRSGLSQREFVQRHGLGLSTLTKWLREERQPDRQLPGRNGADLFQEVKLQPQFGAAGWAAEVVLADGAVLRLGAHADVAWATALFQALRRPC
jgi:transposase-like protein